MTAKGPPTVSLIIFFYNHVHYVEQAVQSAVAQTFAPLEIILSDDCSTDGTFGEIERLSAGRKSRPTLILNHNERNLGLADHINRAVGLASGDLLVFMAGDDISLPDRVTELVQAWEATGRTADLVHSDMMEMTEDGADLHVKKPDPELRTPTSLETLIRFNPHIFGATAAYTPAVFDRFAPLSPEIVTEDLVLQVRAAMLGGIAYVDRPLVRHRVTGISGDFTEDPATSHDALFGTRVKWARWFRDAYRQRLRDMRQVPDIVGQAALDCCEVEYRRWDAVVRLAEASWPRRAAIGLGMLARHPTELAWRLKTVLPYLFPNAYAPFYAWRRRQRQQRSSITTAA